MSGGLGEAALPGAVRDESSVTADWVSRQRVIEDVRVTEMRNVLTDSGSLTEIYRADWFPSPLEIQQAFQITLDAGGVTAWHLHMETTDRLFVSAGRVKIVLYDPRPDSATRGLTNEFRFGERRPALVVIPAGVWHGLRNLLATPSTVVNLVDQAYDYAGPDHWRLPPDSPEIPYKL
jgi:dTDP-4-dehydrorhamnose 3,5-epimerase